MSNWTHVAAIVRLNYITFDDSYELDFEEIFGKECLFDSSWETWEDAEKHRDKYLPMGSEGSLQMSVWVNPNKSHAARYTVSIFGDLRDHESAEEIAEWFKQKCEDSSLSVREACIIAENERADHKVIWVYQSPWLDEKPVMII